MKKVTLLLICIASLFLSSCSLFNRDVYGRSGEVQQNEYRATIPFRYYNGNIIIEVGISGDKYDFILDSGAPNVISTELAEKLKLRIVSRTKSTDSQGNKSVLEIATLENISIGKVNFLNTAAVLNELNLSKDIACLKVHGLIGANLMKKSIWKIDYANQMITLANSIDSLNLPDVVNKIPFEADATGLPFVSVKANGTEIKNVLFDLGSTGHIRLSSKSFRSIVKKTPNLPKVASFGVNSMGIFGVGDNERTYYGQIPSIQIGDLGIENTIILEGHSSLIGNKFFDNFDVVFNWFDSQLLLIEREIYNYSNLSTFGFGFLCRENNLVVAKLIENSSAANAGMQLGDIIIKINNVSYENLTDDQYCEVRANSPMQDKQEVEISVFRNDEVLTFNLKKDSIF